ncbi:hypothetical protein ACFKA9_005673 [Vibrio parahaemolyticus]
MEHFIKILEIVIWPSVVVSGMLLFRRALERLLGRIRSLESSNNKVLFDAQLKELEERSKNDLPTITVEDKESKSWKENLLKVAKLNPRAAMVEAWTAIELACIEAGMAQGTISTKRFHPKILEEFLDKTEGFDKSMISQIMELRKMRNIVIHGRDHDFDYLDGEKYIELADKVLDVVNQMPNKLLKSDS